MPEFLEEFIEIYFGQNFSEIFRTNYEHHEERKGYQNETTKQAVVAKKDGKYFSIHVHLYQNFSPYKRHPDTPTVSITEISAVEYLNRKMGMPQIDTQEVREKWKKHLQIQQQKELAKKNFQEISPLCPNHRIALTVRYNQKNGKPFWGCKKFPSCHFTLPLSSEHKQLLSQI